MGNADKEVIIKFNNNEYEKIIVVYMYHIRYRCLRCLSMEK